MAARSEARVVDALTRGEQLTSRRLLLRPWCAGDASGLPMALADPLVTRWTRIRSNYTRRDAEAWVATDHGPHVLELAIVRKTNDELLGGLRLGYEEGSLRAGFWVRASVRGEGIAGEALHAAARRTTRAVPNETLEVLIRASNERSQRVAHRAGFWRAACLRRHRPVGDRLEDYVLLRYGRAKT